MKKVKLSEAQKRTILSIVVVSKDKGVRTHPNIKNDYFSEGGGHIGNRIYYDNRTINCLIKKGLLKLTHIMGYNNYWDPEPITEEQLLQLALGTLPRESEQYLMYTLSNRIRVDINIEIVE